MLTLGPMPDTVRDLVGRLVSEARFEEGDSGERFIGFLLTGGPGGSSYIDAEGEVWNWHCDWDGSGESAVHVPDGPMKVELLAIAADRVPELAVWFPRRPPCSPDCDKCQGTGWLRPPWPRVLCPECHGMGWLANSRE